MNVFTTTVAAFSWKYRTPTESIQLKTLLNNKSAPDISHRSFEMLGIAQELARKVGLMWALWIDLKSFSVQGVHTWHHIKAFFIESSVVISADNHDVSIWKRVFYFISFVRLPKSCIYLSSTDALRYKLHFSFWPVLNGSWLASLWKNKLSILPTSKYATFSIWNQPLYFQRCLWPCVGQTLANS